MKKLPTKLHLTALALAACFSSGAAMSQEYPSREIRSLCNFAAGTGADVLVRYYSDQLSRLVNRPVIVENRPGANGNLATDALAKSKPDGLTIMITPASSTIAAAKHLSKNLPFDPIKDITPVTTILRLSFTLAVNAAAPYNNVRELAEALKKKPGHGTFGSSNNTGLVGGELYKQLTGLQTTSVPYKSTPQGVIDLLSGQLDFLMADGTFMAGQLKGGKMKLLAVTTGQRTSAFPNVPTMAESGFPGYDLGAWWGVVVPGGTPQPIVDRLANLFNQISATEETKKFLATTAASDALPGNQAQMAAMIKNDMDRWAGYVKLANIEPQ
ncbi:MAG: Bug family tripartite tricarboxylate transporter substrate binding protein [Burkholderiales bacterium]